MEQLFVQVRGFSFGQAVYQHGGTFGPILRPYLALIAVRTGACTMKSEVGSLRVQSGHVGIFAGRAKFEFLYDRNVTTQVSWCEGFLPNLTESKFAQAFEEYDAIRIPDRLQKLQEIGLGVGQQSSTDLNSLRNALGITVCRSFLLEARRSKAEQKIPPKILEAVRLIHDRIGDGELSAEFVANHVSLSPQHFNTAFRKSLGITPSRYIWQRRSENAKRLLLHTRMSHAQIAHECGYKSTAHFSRSMKNHFQETAGELRRNEGFVHPSADDASVKEVYFDKRFS